MTKWLEVKTRIASVILGTRSPAMGSCLSLLRCCAQPWHAGTDLRIHAAHEAFRRADGRRSAAPSVPVSQLA